MQNKLLSRKPKFSGAKSPSRSVAEARAQAGEGIPFISARATSIPSVVSEALGIGKFCFLKDFELVLEKVAETLRAFQPDGDRGFVMIDRQSAQKLALTLVLGGLKSNELLSPEFDSSIVIKGSRSEIFSAIERVKEALARCDNPDHTIEVFREEMSAIGNPALVKSILKAISANAPTLLSEDGTTVSLSLNKKILKDLPSHKKHILKVVSVGFDEESKTATVVVRELISADVSLFEVSDFVKVLCVDDQMRLSLLLAQAARKALEITISVPRVPITSVGQAMLSTVLENASILDFDDSEVLKGLLSDQLQFDI